MFTDLWTEPLAHIELGREADLAIVAPATANILARMAHGLADDMATSTLLAAACPILVCPAMNLRMWGNPATRENVRSLTSNGVHVVGPEEGELAEGEEGPGRMSEPEVIFQMAARLLGSDSGLAGRKVVVTAGPTLAPLDPVRFVGNRSSGRMGIALASAAWTRGAEVTLIAGPTLVQPPHGAKVVRVETSEDMGRALEAELDDASVLIMAAAVSDFVADRPAAQKIKRSGAEGLDIRLEAGPDLLATTRELRESRGILTLGFALETDDPIGNAMKKLSAKGIDLIAVNEAGRPDRGVDAETNQVTLIDSEGVVAELPLMPKTEVAESVLDYLEERLS